MHWRTDTDSAGEILRCSSDDGRVSHFWNSNIINCNLGINTCLVLLINNTKYLPGKNFSSNIIAQEIEALKNKFRKVEDESSVVKLDNIYEKMIEQVGDKISITATCLRSWRCRRRRRRGARRRTTRGWISDLLRLQTSKTSSTWWVAVVQRLVKKKPSANSEESTLGLQEMLGSLLLIRLGISSNIVVLPKICHGQRRQTTLSLKCRWEGKPGELTSWRDLKSATLDGGFGEDFYFHMEPKEMYLYGIS